MRWALKDPSRVEVSGRSVLDVALRENAEGRAIILHNLTNPMMLKGPIREVFPVGPQQVSVALDGRTVAAARLLVAGRVAPVKTELDRLGYDGFVGCEYRPRAGTSAGLGWMRRYTEGVLA